MSMNKKTSFNRSGLALAATLLMALSAPLVQAGPGHDHGDAPAAPTANGPQRLPDGSVFLPKPAQRQLGLRTWVAESSALPRTLELSGTVVMDPNAGGLVQALVPGRIEPGPRGLPQAGQTVRKGEVLAYVRAAAAPIEQANQAAQLAELRAARSLADKRLARLRELADTVPRREIEAAESEAASLAERAAAVAGGLGAREALLAPVSGVIASAQVVSGQVVDARERVFEIVDPQRLRIEALAYDSALALDVGAAALAVGEQRVPLSFIGAARSLREQALPLSFRAESAALAGLALGQPVRVFVQTRTRITALAVPAAALLKNPANQNILWVKTAPERFEPRVVTVQPLDGVQLAVTSGLQAGERVAVQGASLINQIR